MDFDKYKQNGYSRNEIIQKVEHSLQQLTDKELEAVYYDLLTKGYIK